MRKPLTFVLAVLFTVVSGSSGATAFSIVLMARRGKGDLRRTLEGGTKNMNPEDPRFMNEGKGQEITGVSIPTAGEFIMEKARHKTVRLTYCATNED